MSQSAPEYSTVVVVLAFTGDIFLQVVFFKDVYSHNIKLITIEILEIY